MTYHAHYRCERCEQILHEDEDDFEQAGWLTVQVFEEEAHLCCLPCLARWAESDAARELVSAAVARAEESEDE